MTVFKNILAVIIGWIGGSALNIGLISLGNKALPIPGIDPNDMEALAEVMPTLEPQYFVFPFLAHALGTLFGAFLTGLIAVSKKERLAMVIGIIFLIGGIVASYLIPAPTWFITFDLLLAYIPMAWLGGKIGASLSKPKKSTL